MKPDQSQPHITRRPRLQMFMVGYFTALIVIVGGDYYATRKTPGLGGIIGYLLIAAVFGYPLGWVVLSKAKAVGVDP